MPQAICLYLLPCKDFESLQQAIPDSFMHQWENEKRWLIPAHGADMLRSHEALLHGGVNAGATFPSVEIMEALPEHFPNEGVFGISALWPWPESSDGPFAPFLLVDHANPKRFAELKPRIGVMEVMWLLERIANGQNDFAALTKR